MDVNGAFLYGEFEPGLPPVYMHVPEGFEKYYGASVVLLLLKTLYGQKQAAYAFWKKLIAAFENMRYDRSKADPCLHFKWTEHGLNLWVSHVDDNLNCGADESVDEAKELMNGEFKCDDLGSLEEYLGCKIEYNREDGSMKITQPVLLQSFKDEFDLPEGPVPRTPAAPGSILTKTRRIQLWKREMRLCIVQGSANCCTWLDLGLRFATQYVS